MSLLYPLLPPAAAVFVMRHLWPPRLIYLKRQREILFMFLWHLAPVVADITLGHRACPSLVLECSQKQRHAGKPYTVRIAGHEMSLCTCVILGGSDRPAPDLSDSVPYYPPHTSATGHQQLTKLKGFFP